MAPHPQQDLKQSRPSERQVYSDLIESHLPDGTVTVLVAHFRKTHPNTPQHITTAKENS